jgi:hypothetical protein
MVICQLDEKGGKLLLMTYSIRNFHLSRACIEEEEEDSHFLFGCVLAFPKQNKKEDTLTLASLNSLS